VLLSSLEAVVVTSDTSLVPVAFQSVEFIGSEFLPQLSAGTTDACGILLTPLADSLSQLIRTIGLYGRQTVDVNISLTAVSQLWNVADFLSKEASGY
jgi:hypothetical protein